MKLSTKSTLLSALCLLALGIGGVRAQSMTGTVLTQPCNNNGIIGVTVTGLTPPISYTYSNWVAGQYIVHSSIGTTTNNLTNVAAYQSSWINANIWSITASNGTGSASISLTVTPPFTDSVNVINAVCPALGTVQAMGFVGGTSPFSCLWTNVTTSSFYTSNPAIVPNGQYSLVVTDAAGCMLTTATSSSNIYVNSTSNVIANMSGSSANCTNGTATVTASGGTSPYTYLWNTSAVTQNISGLTQGQYNCVVTDAIGCQKTGYYYVTQAVTINYNKTVTNATCLQNNGSILSFVNGGTAPYTFLWSNASTSQSPGGLTGGQNYIVQITDAVGCTATGYVYVGVTTPISITYTATPSSCTTANGSATLTASGGASPYSVIWYTFPSNTTGTSITGKPIGNYSFKVTDANGCVQTGAAQILPSSTMTANIGAGSVVCPATTGSLNVSVSGSNPPFTYLWSNSATTSFISGVGVGGYNCVITDAAGCSVTKYGYLNQTSPINIGFSTVPVTCLYNTNGALTAIPTGGVGPYTYLWSNAQTAATATGLGVGNHYVTVTASNGCQKSGFSYVGNSASSNACYCTITGTIYADANSNCVRNFGENGIQNIQVHCSGYGYTYTDANGIYSFQVPTGTYTITESVQQIYPLSPCQSNNQVVSVTAAANCVTTVNFANNTVILHDLHIITANLNWPVPGNTYLQKVIVQNEGTAVEGTIKLGYAHDGQLAYNNCTPWALTQQNSSSYPNWYSINTGFPSLAPGSNSSSNITYNVPTNIPVSTVVNFNDTVARLAPISTSWLTDNTPWNNVDSHQAYVVSSYDPNFKEVSPKGTGPQGNISTTDSVLTYVIHFQNTGSYFAQNIVVVDTLDSDLRMSTLRPGYSDHNYTVSMNETGVVKFMFNNINLPWQSQYGDNLSSGMFTYSVKIKKNPPLGTQVTNKAAIYFDYNAPVITNSVINTISIPSTAGVNELKSNNSGDMLLFPNPASTFVNLVIRTAQNSTGVLSMYDISGREVSAKTIDLQAGENNVTESTSQLNNGIYFVQFKTENTCVTKKLVIAK